VARVPQEKHKRIRWTEVELMNVEPEMHTVTSRVYENNSTGQSV